MKRGTPKEIMLRRALSKNLKPPPIDLVVRGEATGCWLPAIDGHAVVAPSQIDLVISDNKESAKMEAQKVQKICLRACQDLGFLDADHGNALTEKGRAK